MVQNVTWSNIRVTNVTFPIFVTQTYQNQAAGTQARPDNGQAVMMRDFTWSNFSGTINELNPGDGSCVKPCWYYDGLTGLRHNEAVVFQCATGQSCQNFAVESVKLRAQKQEGTSVICKNVVKEMNPRLGFECRDGLFSP